MVQSPLHCNRSEATHRGLTFPISGCRILFKSVPTVRTVPPYCRRRICRSTPYGNDIANRSPTIASKTHCHWLVVSPRKTRWSFERRESIENLENVFATVCRFSRASIFLLGSMCASGRSRNHHSGWRKVVSGEPVKLELILDLLPLFLWGEFVIVGSEDGFQSLGHEVIVHHWMKVDYCLLSLSV